MMHLISLSYGGHLLRKVTWCIFINKKFVFNHIMSFTGSFVHICDHNTCKYSGPPLFYYQALNMPSNSTEAHILTVILGLITDLSLSLEVKSVRNTVCKVEHADY